jgi:hypothetical protein
MQGRPPIFEKKKKKFTPIPFHCVLLAIVTEFVRFVLRAAPSNQICLKASNCIAVLTLWLEMLASRSAHPLSPLGWPDATTSSFRSSTVCVDDSGLVNSVNGQEVRVTPAQTDAVTLRSRCPFPLPSTEACFHSLVPSSLTYRIGHCLYQGYDATTCRSFTAFARRVKVRYDRQRPETRRRW